MSIKLHWFLPTTGDARGLVGAATACRRASAARSTVSAPPTTSVRPTSSTSRRSRATAEQSGFEGVLTPTGTWCEDAWLTTAALIRETRAAEVPGGVPARRHLADAGRADGGDVPADLRGRLLLNVVTGGDADRAEAVRRPPRPRRALRPYRRVPVGRARRVERASRSTSTASTTRSRARRCRGRPTRCPPIYFGGSSAAGGPGRGPARGRLPDLGRAAGAGRGEDRRGSAGSPPSRAATSGSASAHPHAVARHQRGGLGSTRSGCSTASTRRRSRSAQAALAASESVGQQRMRSLHGGRRVRRRARPGDHAQPVGRRRPGPRRRGHRAGRLPPGGRRPDRGVRTTSASTSSSCPATRIWRRPTGSARA